MAQFPDNIYTPCETENLPGIVYDPKKKQNMYSEDFQNLGGEIESIETWLESHALANGQMINGKIVPSVSSNNLTLALKTLAGSDPSTSDPVFVNINGVIHKITSALSVTKNSGTNWMNAGSAELATQEIDYFAYLGYNAIDGVTIGFARIPCACQYSDFDTTSTSEKYCAISTITHASANDPYCVIGRFASTLSASASYNWSVPTFTPSNLIQYPIFETRLLNYTPSFSNNIGMTFSSITVYYSNYSIIGKKISINIGCSGTLGGTADVKIVCSLPFNVLNTFNFSFVGLSTSALVFENSVTGSVLGPCIFGYNAVYNQLGIKKYTNSLFNLGSGAGFGVNNGTFLIS